MHLFIHILITHIQPGTLILLKKKKKKIQVLQNKCIRFCLRLDKVHHISEENFRSVNWLPTSKRVNQCINIITFRFLITLVFYQKEILEFAKNCRIDTRNKFEKLKMPFRKDKHGTDSYFPCWFFSLK